MWRKRKYDHRRRIAELERSLRLEDVRRQRIEDATTPAELEEALGYLDAVAPLVGRRLGRAVPIGAAAAAIGLLLAAPTIERAATAPDWADISVGTDDPFAGAPVVSVYLVPLDRPAWDNDSGLSLSAITAVLKAHGYSVVETPPLEIGAQDYSPRRHQLVGDQVVSTLADRFTRDRALERTQNRPFAVIGVTSLDQYSPTFLAERFVFMDHVQLGAGGVAVISTARIRGSADSERKRLWKLTMRAIGFYVLHEPRTVDWSVMHEPIRTLDDLDRMSAQFDR